MVIGVLKYIVQSDLESYLLPVRVLSDFVMTSLLF